jgi:hypothetical protein
LHLLIHALLSGREVLDVAISNPSTGCVAFRSQ